ncbi:VTC domain-containing protein [Corynebacterium aquilae]|nr:VTC domain-containing protein [Corynebacterium aquilae]
MNACARLQTRVDRKYVLPAASVADIVAAVDRAVGVRVLDVDGCRVQPYESCYFDTPDGVLFRQASTARRRRMKVRLRHYANSSACFAEVKLRGVRGVTAKSRVPCAVDFPAVGAGFSLGDLDDAASAWVTDEVRRCELIVADELSAVLWGGYHRATLLVGDGQQRMTIDAGVSFADAHGAVCAPDAVVVETKSGSKPGAADVALWRAGFRDVRLSKFGVGMCALNPGAPSNRWRRGKGLLGLVAV